MTPPERSAPRRLGICVFHDPEGIVDEYLVHLLNNLRPLFADLVVMVNGELSEEGRRRLAPFASAIHQRPNRGFDAAAWREALLDHVGFEQLAGYDELVLFNDSFFGPLRPFADVFREMEARRIDFWGLSAHGETDGIGLCPYGFRPRSLQTYFLVFHERILRDPRFGEFWSGLPEFRHFEEVAERFGGVLTRHFADLGYTWAAVCDTADLEGTRAQNLDPHTYHLREMVVNRGYPVLKRRSFLVPKDVSLRHGDGRDLRAVLDFIQARSIYDLRLAFSHLLRRMPAARLKDALDLHYVLPADSAPVPAAAPGLRAVLVAHLYYPDQFEHAAGRLRRLPPEVDVVVTTDSAGKAEDLHRRLDEALQGRLDIRQVEPRGRDWSALLAGCRDLPDRYDLIGFLHDKKSTQKEFIPVGTGFRDLLWDNLLASEAHVRRIFALFESTPWLGLLVPPAPLHGSYFNTGTNRWAACFDETVRLARRLGIRAPIDREHPPIAVGSAFWGRTDALQPLFAPDWTPEDFPPEPLAHDGTLNHALERILPFAAQSRGYLTGWIMTTDQAAAESTNLRHMIEGLRRAADRTPGLRYSSFRDYRRSLASALRLLRLPGLRQALALAGAVRQWAAVRGPRFLRRAYTRLRLRRR